MRKNCSITLMELTHDFCDQKLHGTNFSATSPEQTPELNNWNEKFVKLKDEICAKKVSPRNTYNENRWRNLTIYDRHFHLTRKILKTKTRPRCESTDLNKSKECKQQINLPPRKAQWTSWIVYKWVNEVIADSLIPDNIKAPQFYMPWKINKVNNPERPIISLVSSHANEISRLIKPSPQPDVKELQCYIKDTTDLWTRSTLN